MNGPAVFHFTVRVWHRVLCSINNMRRLKYDSENEACHIVHDHNAQQNLPPGDIHHNQGNKKYVAEIQNFSGNQYQPLCANISFLLFYKSLALVFNNATEIFEN